MNTLPSFVTKYILDNQPITPDLSLEDYYDEKFFFLENGLGRNILEIPVSQLSSTPHIIQRLTANDACFLGIILAECYWLTHRKANASLYLPKNRLEHVAADAILYSYAIDCGTIRYYCLNNNQYHDRHILDVARDHHLIAKFSSSHAYQIGFYAGEILSTLKETFSTIESNISCIKEKLEAQ